MSAHASAATGNRLLAVLPVDERERIVTRAEPVMLAAGETLVEPGAPLRHVYFPIEGFISRIAQTDARARLEVGLIGDEGMLGASLVLGIDVSPAGAMVRGEGSAHRMDAAAFRRELAASPRLERLARRYLHVLMVQLVQAAVCTHYHGVDARLARSLLLMHDRAHSDVFAITHRFLAFMLGVRRAGISVAASALQRRKLIRYHRGRLTILDRNGLEAAACGCYFADRETYARTMT